MTVAVALVLSAAILGWQVPRRLGRLDLRRRDPLVLIISWLVSMAAVLFAAIAGVALLLVPDHGNVGTLVATLHHCWDAISHGSPPRIEAFGGLLATGAVAAMAVRLAVIATRSYRRRARRRREHLSILRLAAKTDNESPGRTPILWLAHDRPLAFSLSGRPGVIVATEGLNRHLPADSVAAVLSHERAHLKGRHHLLLAVTDALSAVLPFVPLFRQAPGAMRELVELAADVASVRAHGIAAVRTALDGVCGHDTPGLALAMARDAVDVRLARLRDAVPAPSRVRRALTCSAASVVAAVAPLLVAGVLLIAIGIATCPITGT